MAPRPQPPEISGVAYNLISCIQIQTLERNDLSDEQRYAQDVPEWATYNHKRIGFRRGNGRTTGDALRGGTYTSGRRADAGRPIESRADSHSACCSYSSSHSVAAALKMTAPESGCQERPPVPAADRTT